MISNVFSVYNAQNILTSSVISFSSYPNDYLLQLLKISVPYVVSCFHLASETHVLLPHSKVGTDSDTKITYS